MGGKPSKQTNDHPVIEADQLDVFMQDSKLHTELEKETHQAKQDDSDSEDEGEDLAYSPQEQSGTVSENNRFFKVKRVEVRDPDSGKIVSVRAELILKNNNLAYQIQGYQIPVTWQNEEFIQRKPKVKLEYLLMNYERMKKIEKPSTEFTKLLEFLQVEYNNFLQKAKKMIKDGVITFDAVWYLFRKGAKCFGRIVDDQVVGAEVTNTRFLTSMLGEMFEVGGKCIKSNGEYFFVHRENFYIREFMGIQPISTLTVQPMNEKIYVMLVERGKQFESVALGHHYKQYGGYILYERAWGTNLFKADGRVMVDIKTFQRMNPEYGNFKDPNQIAGANAAYMQDQYNNYNYNNNPNMPAQGLPAKMTTIQKNVLYMTWPTVAGFSFACKKWGEVLVSLLTDIQFDDRAYSRLVLSKEKKNMIKALVDHHQKHRKIFTDIISGKGSGRIFLLHGPPGVGKTLTAEAIAEHLHDPLYSVTVGELGTNTKDLEAKLQEILEVASIWNAVILIDEADIFLEQRNDFDVTRNAMVGIFLRLLEYHQGVLFLTTNRVKCFDEAFHSRISVALRYSELSNEARRRIWHNFLKMVEVHLQEEELNQLSERNINGRQIRTTLQLAQALAQSEKKNLDFSYIQRTLSVSNQFEDTQAALPDEENWDKFKFSPTFDDELDMAEEDNDNKDSKKDIKESKPASKEHEDEDKPKKKKKKKAVLNNNNN